MPNSKQPYQGNHKATMRQPPAKAWTGQPYPSYKDSGVEWLGQVPEHWEVRRLKNWLGINNKTLPEDTDPEYTFRYVDIGSVSTGYLTETPKRLRFGNAPSRARRIVAHGDTIVSTVRTYLKAVWYADNLQEPLIASTGFAVLTPDKNTLPKFVSYICQSNPFTDLVTSESVGIAYPAIAETRLGTFSVCIPPLPEQAAIAHFLDHATQRIQRHIQVKQKLIKLLEEQKQVIIHQAVTGQINVQTGQPYPVYKDSGVEWLERVPEHWEVLSLKRWVSTKITDGPHETPDFLSAGVPFLSAEAVCEVGLDFGRQRGFISQKVHEMYCRKCRPQRDDIFMCKSGATTGKVAIVETDDEFSIWSPLALIRVDPRRVMPKLLLRVLQSRYLQGQVRDTWSYGTQPNLSMYAMERLVIALPSLDEQRAILEWLDSLLLGLYKASELARREINLLHEYRTRLIADVVTGKLDVREAAARLPQSDPLPTAANCQDGTELAAPGRSPRP